MTEGRVYLDELNTKSTNYRVKVKVLQKGKAQRSAKDVLYQTVVLQDDKGHKMRGILFGDQVAAHEEAIMCNGVYEIANAPIRPMQDQYRRDPAEVPYTMGFGKQTLIRPLATTPEALLPEYQNVSQVPKTATPYDIFDVAGIMLYVEPAAREVPSKQGRKSTVREMVITDPSSEQPIVVSAWNDLSEDECDKLTSIVDKLPVIGFTALRVSSYKGFSLTCTTSTIINTDPTGPKITAQIEWRDRNRNSLTDLQTKISQLRDPDTPTPLITLGNLTKKKASKTLQDERYQLNVTVPKPDLQKINAYLGCSNCGKRTDYASGESFKCETCTKEGVLSEPRITFNCEVSDGTGQIEITAFTTDAVAMFQMSAADIFHMKHTNDSITFTKACEPLKTGPLVIEVSPKIALSRNNILQWALRKIVAVPSQHRDASKQSEANTDDQNRDHSSNTVPIVVTSDQPASVARKLQFEETGQASTNLTLVDIAVTSDYTALRKLPASVVTSPENIQLQSEAPTETDNNEITDPPDVSTNTTNALSMPTTPLLKTPKAEKAASSTPETPAQGTPKRNTTKHGSGSPTKKKKNTSSSAATQ